jgi:NADPH:quinone reductase-like Zn-dependent oxidoreductase
MTDIEVNRADLGSVRVVEEPTPEPGDGHARLRIDEIALTSNNVTYGVIGHMLKYWDFFPPHDGDETWGRIPAFGFAEVVRSASPDLAEGTRVFGYLPMSTHLVVEPDKVDDRGFMDATEHRRSMSAVYNHYRRVDSDPAYDPAREAEQMLLFPLFMTSFMVEDFLDDDERTRGTDVVVSSASSKTSIGTAFLARRRGASSVTGLTSERNRAFVEELGVYDRVLSYDEVDDLHRAPSTYVDVAGDVPVREAVHRRLEGTLAYSMIVGGAHWDRMTPTGELVGPAPEFFFAPTQVQKRTQDWGPAGLDERIDGAWRDYLGFVDEWLQVRRSAGPDAVVDVWRELLAGASDPRVGHVVTVASGGAG